MRKIIGYIMIACVLALSVAGFAACNSEDKGVVLPAGTDVDTITVNLPESGTDYTFEGDDLTKVVDALHNQEKLEKDEVFIPVLHEAYFRKGIYTLTITTKKAFLKKSETFEVMVGVETDRTEQNGDKVNYSDEDEIRINGYNGKLSADLKAAVKNVVEREDAKFSADRYDKIITALTEKGYTFRDIEFNENVNNKQNYLHTSLDLKGVSASKNGATSIRIILCKSVEAAKSRDGGSKILRLYVGAYSQADYDMIKEIINK